MDVVLVGDRRFSRHLIEYALSRLEVVGIVTPTVERSLELGYEPLANEFTERSVPVVATDDINDPDVVQTIREWDPDLSLCTSWTQLVDSELLEVPYQGWLGMHPSDLPRGRGGAAVNWSLIKGADDVTLTLFEFTEGIDDGRIIEQATVDIEKRDTVETVFERLATAGRKLVDRLAESREIDGRKQDRSEATYRPSRTPDDGLIDWEKDTETLHDWVRALSRPYPGAFTFVDGNRLIVWTATEGESTSESAVPSEVVAVVPGEGVDIATGSGSLRLRRVQLEDGPAMWADNWAREHGVTAGTALGDPADFPEWLYTGIRNGDGGYEYPTNVRPGEEAEIQAVVRSHGTEKEVTVRAVLSDREIIAEQISVSGRETVRVPFSTECSGTHTLRVTFATDGSEIDRRILKVFSVA